MIRVYHNDMFLAYILNPSLKKNTVHLVAEVDTDDLDEAFRLTNNITHLWVINKGVRAVESVQHRSTSVGDLLEWNDKIYVVESFGFRELTSEEVSEIKKG